MAGETKRVWLMQREWKWKGSLKDGENSKISDVHAKQTNEKMIVDNYAFSVWNWDVVRARSGAVESKWLAWEEWTTGWRSSFWRALPWVSVRDVWMCCQLFGVESGDLCAHERDNSREVQELPSNSVYGQPIYLTDFFRRWIARYNRESLLRGLIFYVSKEASICLNMNWALLEHAISLNAAFVA